ncbi:MAG: MotA/TolQ/ExbB proton channel family protein [Lachnospiraceae bacterium]|nr:MotA/TolQ/ExbB proton channel family protein [Lachnospiraceae bacterium]
MDSLAIIIGNSINGLILVLAIITIAGFAYVVMNISKLQNTIDEKHKKKRSTEFTPGGIQKTPDAYTWEEILEYKEEYNKIQLIYATFEQFVPIFPLLGILGTVAGLIQHLDDINKMKEALTLSMSTTFWGLIAAIVLKFADAILVSKTVNKMELYFDTFEQNYNMAKDKYALDNKQDQ